MDREASGPEVGRICGRDQPIRRSGNLGILIRQAIGFQGGKLGSRRKLISKSSLIFAEYDLHLPNQPSPILINNDRGWLDCEEKPSASMAPYASDLPKLGP